MCDLQYAWYCTDTSCAIFKVRAGGDEAEGARGPGLFDDRVVDWFGHFTDAGQGGPAYGRAGAES